MRTVSVQQANSGHGLLIDVRTPAEYAGCHAPAALLHPLSHLQPAEVARMAGDGPVHVVCRTGTRARHAAQRLLEAGVKNVAVVDGGMQAWEEAGLPIIQGRQTISLERQVRIAAGSLVLLGLTLGISVHPGFLGLSFFVGGGLIFAGITEWCGMGMLLARMPWNQSKAAEPA